MSRRRKRFGRHRKVDLKRDLAIRDRLVSEGAFERTSTPLVRCAECDSLIPFEEITLGHIQPRSEGGGDRPSNLRLECHLCNQLDNERRHVIRAIIEKPEDQVRPEEFQRVLAGERRFRSEKSGHLYDSVRVLDAHGETVSFTSHGRASHLLDVGRVTLRSTDPEGRPDAVQLTHARPIRNPYQAPHLNQCVICDARRYLRVVNLWPRWHPEWTGAKKSHRTVPLCLHCSIAFQDRMEWVASQTGLPPPPETCPERIAVRVIRTALGLHRAGLPLPSRLLETAMLRGEVDLLGFVSTGNPDETERNLREALREARTTLATQAAVWTWAIRRNIVVEGIDYEALFWTFAESRRSAFAPYLRTDGRFIRELREYLAKVRHDRRAESERRIQTARESPLLLHGGRFDRRRPWILDAKKEGGG